MVNNYHSIPAGRTDTKYANRNKESASSIRVLICSDYLPPSDGGVEQVVEQLAYRLCDRGCKVGVFTLSSPEEQPGLSNDSRVTVFESDRIDLTEYVGLQSSLSVSAVRDFNRVVSRFDPDLVHVHNRFFFTSYIGLMYKYIAGYPLVTTMHLGGIGHINGAGGVAAQTFQSVFARRLVRNSDAVVCVSNAVEDIARSLGAVNTETIPNSVDLSQFSVDKSEFDKTLLYVGRLVRNNGPQDLVRAVPDIIEQHPDAHIHLVGGGKLESELRELIEELSVSKSVTIHGFVDDIVSMYEAADVFCRPSYSEGLPLTLLESMATHSVPVVTPVAGASEVLSKGETGHFVEVGNPKSIAVTINRLFENPDEVDRLAEAARTAVERQHTWEKRTENVLRTYQEVINDE